jgi:hypothetical protein
MTRHVLQAVCVLTITVGCGSSYAPTAPTTTSVVPTVPPPPTPNVGGRWDLVNPPGVEGQVTILELTQVGSDVTGTWERVAAFVISDKGPVSGNISGSNFMFTARIVTEYTPRFPGDEDSPCHITTTFVGGTLAVNGGAMTGLVRADASQCVPRPRSTMTTWTRK